MQSQIIQEKILDQQPNIIEHNQSISQILQQNNNTTQQANQTIFNFETNKKLIEGSEGNQSFFIKQNPMLWVILLVILFVLVKLIRRKKIEKNIIYLVGQRGAGKTKLLYKLNDAKSLDTVPSIKNNSTTYKLDRRIKQMIDVTGDNHTKQEFLKNLKQAFCIIQVVDGSNPSSFAAAAELLYRILISKIYKKQQIEYCILLNKNDTTGYIGGSLFRKKIQQQIERIKLSKRSLIQQNQFEEDHLREQKSRFNLEGNGITIIEGSVTENKLSGLNKFIDNL